MNRIIMERSDGWRLSTMKKLLHVSASLFLLAALAGCPVPGNGEFYLEKAPVECRLYTRPAGPDITLVSLGLGPSLPLNEWSTWRIDSPSYIWLGFFALAGKTYTVRWEDLRDFSASSIYAPIFNADIEVGAFLSDGLTRVAGWDADVDDGYAVGKAISVVSSREIRLRIRPVGGSGATGGFCVRIDAPADASSATGYSWYLDGIVQSSANGFNTVVLPGTLSSGSHRLVGVATRMGRSFSEEYSFTK
jgi:hypothetical protein